MKNANATLSSNNYLLLLPIGSTIADCEVIGEPFTHVSSSSKTSTKVKVRHSCGTKFDAICSELIKGLARCPKCNTSTAPHRSNANSYIDQTIGTYRVIDAWHDENRMLHLQLRCNKCGLEGVRKYSTMIRGDHKRSKARTFDPSHCPRCELIESGLLQLPKVAKDLFSQKPESNSADDFILEN